MAVDEGRATVLVVNKWDLVEPKWKEKAAKYMMKQVEKLVPHIDPKAVHFVSATDGIRVSGILKEVQKVYSNWNARISTGMLNIWLRKFKKVQKMPTTRDRKLKILYVAQIKSRPPTFSVFINDLEMTDENYIKFMKKHLSSEFGLHGIPIRFIFRGTKYKRLKKRVEKVIKGNRGEIRRMMLKRRKIKTFAKIKLDEVNSRRQRFTKGSNESKGNAENGL